MKRSRLNPVSKKRRSLWRAREAVISEVLLRDGTCQFWTYAWEPNNCIEGDLVGAPTSCAGPLDCHEIIPRSAWALGYLEPSNITVLCRSHHTFVTDNPAAAHRLGLHGFSWERPDARGEF